MSEVPLRDQWAQTRATHHWVTLDGEEWSCNDCDTKSGWEVCPASTPKEEQSDDELRIR